jgi:membrane fusion protein, multidrug efflux system
MGRAEVVVRKLAAAGVAMFVLAVGTAGEAPSLDRQEIRAQLSPKRYTSLSAEIGAKIDRVAVREGEQFKAGQTLISFDCALQSAQAQRAKAALFAADKVALANRRLAELNSVGQLEVDTAEAELAKARADVALMDATLSKCSVIAPFAGRVAEQKLREKQFVQAGQPILDIIDDSTLELEFIVPSRWVAWLKPGYQLRVRIDETTDTYPAKITRLGAKVDPVSQSIKVAAVIDGRFPQLIAGMSGRIELSPPAAVAAR